MACESFATIRPSIHPFPKYLLGNSSAQDLKDLQDPQASQTPWQYS